MDNLKNQILQPKSALSSKGIQGGAGGIVAGLLMIVEGYASSDPSQLGTGVLAVVAGIWAIYGRIKARRQIGGISG